MNESNKTVQKLIGKVRLFKETVGSLRKLVVMDLSNNLIDSIGNINIKTLRLIIITVFLSF